MTRPVAEGYKERHKFVQLRIFQKPKTRLRETPPSWLLASLCGGCASHQWRITIRSAVRISQKLVLIKAGVA